LCGAQRFCVSSRCVCLPGGVGRAACAAPATCFCTEEKTDKPTDIAARPAPAPAAHLNGAVLPHRTARGWAHWRGRLLVFGQQHGLHTPQPGRFVSCSRCLAFCPARASLTACQCVAVPGDGAHMGWAVACPALPHVHGPVPLEPFSSRFCLEPSWESDRVRATEPLAVCAIGAGGSEAPSPREPTPSPSPTEPGRAVCAAGGKAE
jgi:hypothetical protein